MPPSSPLPITRHDYRRYIRSATLAPSHTFSLIDYTFGTVYQSQILADLICIVADQTARSMLLPGGHRQLKFQLEVNGPSADKQKESNGLV